MGLRVPVFHRYRWAIATFAALNALDIALTKVSLEQFGAIEANPVVDYFLKNSFAAAIGLKVAVILLVASIARYLWSRHLVRSIVAAGNLILLAVIAYQLVGINASMPPNTTADLSIRVQPAQAEPLPSRR